MRTDGKLDETVSHATKVPPHQLEDQVAGKKRNVLDISSSFSAQDAGFSDISTIAPAADQSSDTSDILSKSISSAFFKSLRTSKTTDATDHHSVS